MKKTFALSFIMIITHYSFAQKTFTSKQEALAWLTEIFSTNFIKTPVIINNENKEISYDYKINENHILIMENNVSNINQKTTIPYEKMREMLSFKNNDYFKNSTGIGFRANPLESYHVSNSTKHLNIISQEVAFPFEFKKGDIVVPSIKNAINTINATDRASKKIADSIKSAIDLTMAGTFLKDYSLYNSDNILVNMHEFIEQKRRFKDKPTLVVTLGSWCHPCVKRIDDLLNKGILANYNILIVNKDGKTTYSEVKTKMSNHTPSYFTNEILFLLDRDNNLELLDKNGVPMFIWLDKNLKVMGSFLGFISNASIIKKLEEIK